MSDPSWLDDAFDVLLVSTAPVADARDLLDDATQHPVDERVDIDTSLRLRIDRVEHDFAQRVMDECEPKGWSRGHRQWGCTWGFFREKPPGPAYGFYDTDQALSTAVALSRLIHPNVISSDYTARVFRLAAGAFEIHPISWDNPRAYVHDSVRRRWLTKLEADALGVLFRTYWPLKDALPSRIKRALWNHEYASRTRDFNIRLVIVASALEALVHTDRRNSTGQFLRTVQIAHDLDLTFSEADGEDAYDIRSEVAHGNRLASIIKQDPQTSEGDSVASMTGKHTARRMEGLLLSMEEILRTAIRRAIEQAPFREIFSDDDRIRAKWPIRTPKRYKKSEQASGSLTNGIDRQDGD